MPKPKTMSKSSALGTGDSRHPADGSSEGRPLRDGSASYGTGTGDSRAMAKDAGHAPMGSRAFAKAGTSIPRRKI